MFWHMKGIATHAHALAAAAAAVCGTTTVVKPFPATLATLLCAATVHFGMQPVQLSGVICCLCVAIQQAVCGTVCS